MPGLSPVWGAMLLDAEEIRQAGPDELSVIAKRWGDPVKPQQEEPFDADRQRPENSALPH